jgi:protein SCO1/2
MAAAIAVLVGVGLWRAQSSAASPPAGTAYSGTALGWQAPDFELTDQNGVRVGLADFRGSVVVLAFLDSRCDETCPLTAFEIRLTNISPGDPGGRVIFLGVNVNRDFNSTEDIAKFTNTYLLNEIPTWRFLTGEVPDLSAVWDSYSVEVIDQPEEEDYEHTPGIFIIDPEGVLRWYVSTPLLDGLGADQWQGPMLHEILVSRIRELMIAAATKQDGVK